MNASITRRSCRDVHRLLALALLLAGLMLGATTAAAAHPAQAACPVNVAACDAAALLRAHLLSGDLDPVIDAMTPRDFVCTGTETGAIVGELFPLCEGAAPGEVRTAYTVGWLHSHGSEMTRDKLAAYLADWVSAGRADLADEYGSGALRLHSLGCPDTPDGGAPCRDRFSAVFSAIRLIPDAREPLRLQLIFHMEATDNGHRIEHLSAGLVLPDALPVVLGGGRLELAGPYLQGGAGTFYPWAE